MALSKNSIRVQFTLNIEKPKEKQIAEFLNGCINPNNSIKEIIYNYMVSNCEVKSLQVTQIEVTQSEGKLAKVSNFEENALNSNNIVTQSEGKSLEVSELEVNEMDELSKFL